MTTLKKKIENNEKVLGVFIGTYSPNFIEISSYADFDFVVIDDEHGAFSTTELENMIRTAESVGLVPIVRVSYDLSSIQKALDRGAQGIQVPMVNTKEDAEAVIQKAKFPPLGNRGVAYSHRAAKFGSDGGNDFLVKSNEDILISVHIETEEAVNNFKEIMSVEGIDLAFLGTTDLSVSMGYPEGLHHEKVQTTVKKVYSEAKNNKLHLGTVASDIESAKKAYEMGADYVALVGMSYMLKSFSNFTDKVKSGINENY